MSDLDSKSRQNGDLRGEVAYRAARLIAEEGVTDFATAKQKAARQMGITDQGSLPDNQEIDAALRAYQSIFQVSSQPQECQALRRIAADAMRRLDRFSPWLIGAVLSGAANRFSQIELEVVADDAKQLEMFFLNEAIPFETRVNRSLQPSSGNTLSGIVNYQISLNEVPIVIAVYPHHAKRFAHHPQKNLKHASAQLAAVEMLFAL